MIPRSLQIAIAVLLVSVFATGFYLLHLKHRAEETAQGRLDTTPVAPPVAGTTEKVAVFLASDDEAALRKRELSVALPAEPGERARQVLRAVIKAYQEKDAPHLVGPAADINNVYFVNRTTALIDANAAFADAHPSGILVEELTLASLVRTLSAAMPDVTRVKFLVDGKERETLAGHADLTNFYAVDAVSAAVKEAQ